jgi:hypothetical protein
MPNDRPAWSALQIEMVQAVGTEVARLLCGRMCTVVSHPDVVAVVDIDHHHFIYIRDDHFLVRAIGTNDEQVFALNDPTLINRITAYVARDLI